MVTVQCCTQLLPDLFIIHFIYLICTFIYILIVVFCFLFVFCILYLLGSCDQGIAVKQLFELNKLT